MGRAARRSATRTPRQDRVCLRVGVLASAAALLTAPAALAVDFAIEIRPLLVEHCLVCHQPSNRLGQLSLESAPDARLGGAAGPALIPGDPDGSSLLARALLPAGSPGAMPPAGPRLADAELDAIREWIRAGAPWPDRLNGSSDRVTDSGEDEELELVRRIHRRILRQVSEGNSSGFEAYDESVPGTETVFRMVAVPAGEFVQGTPESEPGRNSDEGPQRTIQLDAFWMGAREVGWDEFRAFMLRESEGYIDPDGLVAAISSPTPPYMEMSFGMGIGGYPAISMTQHAASKYAQWLSAKTGRFYRLPTEAEWEYACRAGTSSAYSFGDSTEELGEYGWYWDNSNAQYQPVGTKKPNPWGLHDMHGNVWEWTLDRYEPAFEAVPGGAGNTWVRADALYPRVVRGGSWMDDAEALRCGARRASESDWKMQDPQLPKSIWYHTDAQWLGFRLVRPLRIPTVQEMHAYWNSASGKED